MYFCIGPSRTRVDFSSSTIWTEDSVFNRMIGHLHVHAVAVDLDGCGARVFIRSEQDLWLASRMVAAYMENCHSDAEVMSRNESLDDRQHTDEVEARVAALCRTQSESDGDTESETE
jgi:hypothetical protein